MERIESIEREAGGMSEGTGRTGGGIGLAPPVGSVERLHCVSGRFRGDRTQSPTDPDRSVVNDMEPWARAIATGRRDEPPEDPRHETVPASGIRTTSASSTRATPREHASAITRRARERASETIHEY